MDNYQNELYGTIESSAFTESDCGEGFDNSQTIATQKKNVNKHPLLTIQLVVALCALLFLYILKFTGAPFFDYIIGIYQTAMNESVVFDSDTKELDYSWLFATDDEV